MTFLKETLVIPLDKEKLAELNLTINGECGDTAASSSSNLVDNIVKINKTTDEKAEYKDFLNKFDSFINESKVKLKNLETQNSSLAIAEYLSNNEQYNKNNNPNIRNNNNNNDINNSFREDDIFARNDSLFRGAKAFLLNKATMSIIIIIYTPRSIAINTTITRR